MSTNGLISFKVEVPDCCPEPFPIATLSEVAIIAPYWVDINTMNGGDVLYEIHTPNNPGSAELLDKVNSLITNHTGNYHFSGTWMLVVEWHRVHSFNDVYSGVSSLPSITPELDGSKCTFFAVV